MADPVEADETTTLYVATLFRPDGKIGEGAFGGFIGFYLDGTDNSDLFVGTGGKTPKYHIEARGGAGKIDSGVTPVSGQVALLVVKAEFKPGPDVFTLYVNPDTKVPEPKSGTVKNDLDLGKVDQLVLYSTGAFSMDEFRVADSFTALASYPSPESLKQIPPAPPLEEVPPKIVRDDFSDKYELDWEIRNADQTHVSLKKNAGSLTITTQPGGFYGASKSYKNLFLTANPVAENGDLEVTACVIGFDPKANYQQAGLLCMDDEDNYVKWTYEWNEARGQQVLALIRETSGTPASHTYVYEIPKGKNLWLRLTKLDDRYAYSSSADGKDFKVHGALSWGDGAPAWLGLKAGNSTDTAPEIDAVFDYFEATSKTTVEVPSARPQFTMPEDRLLYMQIRTLLGRQELDEAAKQLDKAIAQHPDSTMLWGQRYSLFQYLSHAERTDDAIGQLKAYIDFLLPRSVGSMQSAAGLSKYVGQIMDAYADDGRSDQALKVIESLISKVEQVEGVAIGAIESLVAQKALFLAKQDKADEAASIMQKQLAAARKAIEDSPENAGSVLRVAARLKDLVALETTLESDKVAERRDEMLAFLTEQAKAQPAEPNIVTQYLQEHYGLASSLSRTEPDQAERFLNSMQEFLDECLDPEARKQYARYNLDSIRRRIETACFFPKCSTTAFTSPTSLDIA